MPEALEIRQQLREERGEDIDSSTIYVNTTIDEDIMIEEGKTYLIALEYVEECGCYSFRGFKVMTREVDTPNVQNVRKLTDLRSLNVKN